MIDAERERLNRQLLGRSDSSLENSLTHFEQRSINGMTHPRSGRGEDQLPGTCAELKLVNVPSRGIPIGIIELAVTSGDQTKPKLGAPVSRNSYENRKTLNE